jgi:hypothetical protein
MAVYKYVSATDFDKTLELAITESNEGSKTEFTFSGFRSLSEAKRYAVWWENSWYGYSPSASAFQSNTGNFTVLCSRWNSCD